MCGSHVFPDFSLGSCFNLPPFPNSDRASFLLPEDAGDSEGPNFAMCDNEIGSTMTIHAVENFTLIAVPEDVELEKESGRNEGKRTSTSGPMLISRGVVNFTLRPQQSVMTLPCVSARDEVYDTPLSGERRPCLGGERWMYRDFCPHGSDDGVGVFEFTHDAREGGETDSFLLHCEGPAAFVLFSFRCRVTAEVLDADGTLVATRQIGFKSDESDLNRLLWLLHRNDVSGVYVQRPEGARVSVRLSIPSHMAGYIVYLAQDAVY